MCMNPFSLFAEWYAEALQHSAASIPSACCFSTVGLDGFPNARFVSLKAVADERFLLTGPLNSRKGREVDACNKVALTFWWATSEKQVRIQGTALPLASEEADACFEERPWEAKIVSVISRQGEILQNADSLIQKFIAYQKEHAGEQILRPKDWSGFAVYPVRMEFMQFRQNRLHERLLFQKENSGWTMTRLQP
jgi:pyridoxamine 5'-phosphate oxidase